jgi:hypothetical protein
MQIMGKNRSFLCKFKHISFTVFFSINKNGSRLSTEAFDALLRVRENTPSPVDTFKPTKSMFSLFNSNMYQILNETEAIMYKSEEVDEDGI